MSSKRFRTKPGSGRQFSSGTAGVSRASRRQASSLASGDKALRREKDNKFDDENGFPAFVTGDSRIGYLCNMLPATVVDSDRIERSALDMYFLQQDGATFKATIIHQPYFYVSVVDEYVKEVSEILIPAFLRRSDVNTHVSKIKGLPDSIVDVCVIFDLSMLFRR